MKLNRRKFIGLSGAVGAFAFVSSGIPAKIMKASTPAVKKEDVWIPTHCKACAADNRCHLLVHRVNGVAVKIEGNPASPTNQGRNCAKSAAALLTLYNPYRVKFPVKRMNPEKGRGIDPKWKEISWEEALNTIAEQLKKVRSENPRKFVFMTGHAASLNINTDIDFADAFGTPNLIVGATSVGCGGSSSPLNKIVNGGYQARADMKYCQYFLNLGANSQQGGKGNSEEIEGFTNARVRGLKVVNVSPILSPSCAKTDEWVPIIPGTAGYFLLSMINVILNELQVFDDKYLKERTNAPYLIDEEGLYLRNEEKEDDFVRGLRLGKPLVWDRASQSAKAFDDLSLQEPVLEGTFVMEGKTVRPSFQALKDHVKNYTPEKGQEITGISAETLRRLAKEWVENAQIGKTITIDGQVFPYRPVAVISEQGSKCHVDNYMVVHATKILSEIVGATDVPGSAKAAGIPSMNINPVDGLNTSEELIYQAIHLQPETISLQDQSPITGSSSGLAWLTLKDPKAYGIDYEPEILGIWGGNPQALLGDFERINSIFRKFSFTFAISYEFDEPTEYADIVLPENSWLERFGLTSYTPKTSFTDVFKEKGDYGWALQQPVLAQPLYNTKEGNQIILELCEKLNLLHGEEGLFARLNQSLGLRKPYLLDPNQTYTWEQIMNVLCLSKTGGQQDLNGFKKNGLVSYKVNNVKNYYGATRFPKARVPLYLEEFVSHKLRFRKELEEKDVKPNQRHEATIKQLSALPYWEPHPEHKAPKDYDLFCINYKNMQHHFANNITNAWLMELTEEQDPYSLRILMNRSSALKRGFQEGDRVEVEGYTGGRIQGALKLTQLIHDEVLGIAGAYGLHSQDILPAAHNGPSFGDLLKFSEEVFNPLKISIDRDLKVKIRKI